jgi:hypothetical protein
VLYQPRDETAPMPLELLALGSWIEGRHVVIVDGRFELAPEARVVELARSALLLWVSVRTGEPLREALRVSRAARGASPELAVIWSGPHVVVDPGSCLETGAVDACAPGAGEEPLQAAVAALRSGRALASVPGLQAVGAAPVAPSPPPTQLWPRADYSLLDVERYFEERGARRLDYASSRGERDSEWLGLRPERVVGEVLELADRYRVGELCFKDQDFFADPDRVVAAAEGLLESGSRLAWRAGARPEDVLEAEPAMLERLAASGCRGLELVAGDAGRERLLEAGARLSGAGIGGRFVFEVVEPGESGLSLASAVSTARALCAMDSRFATRIHKWLPAPTPAPPGRPLEEWAGFERKPWRDGVAERRLARVAFYFAEAQRAPAAGPRAPARTARLLFDGLRARRGRAVGARANGAAAARSGRVRRGAYNRKLRWPTD